MKSLQEHITEAVTPKYLTLAQLKKLKEGELLIATYIDPEEGSQGIDTEEQICIGVNVHRFETESTDETEIKFEEQDRACYIKNSKSTDIAFPLEHHHRIVKFQLK